MAVCEKPDRTMLNISKSRLPAGVKEGDVLILEGDKICVDSVETARKKKTAEQLLKKLEN
jgi:ASC-1-like (ASCH) protein